MAYVEKVHQKNEDYAYVIRGAIYRLKISVIDWGEDVQDRARFHVSVFALTNDYHKNTAYSMVGEQVYVGISLKEAWDEIKTYVGKVDMPEELKELQPFLAQQT